MRLDVAEFRKILLLNFDHTFSDKRLVPVTYIERIRTVPQIKKLHFLDKWQKAADIEPVNFAEQWKKNVLHSKDSFQNYFVSVTSDLSEEDTKRMIRDLNAMRMRWKPPFQKVPLLEESLLTRTDAAAKPVDEKEAGTGPDPSLALSGLMAILRTRQVSEKSSGSTAVAQKPKKMEAILLSKVLEGNDCVRLKFRLPFEENFSFRGGQFMVVEATVGGKKVRRNYSLIQPPSVRGTVEFLVKKIPNGLMSNYLYAHIKPGDSVLLSPPKGKFVYDFDEKTDALVLTAGSGVGAGLSLVSDILENSADTRVTWIHYCRNRSDFSCAHYVRELTREYPRLRFALALTGEAPENWRGLTGRLNSEHLKVFHGDYKTAQIFLCGPEGFRLTARAVLEKILLPPKTSVEDQKKFFKKRFKEEIFFTQKKTESAPETKTRDSAEAPPDNSDVSASDLIRVQFTESRFEICGGPPATILALAEEVGINVDSSCLSGTCGTCKARLVSGNVKSLAGGDLPLSDEEIDQGYILTCVSTPDSYAEVEL